MPSRSFLWHERSFALNSYALLKRKKVVSKDLLVTYLLTMIQKNITYCDTFTEVYSANYQRNYLSTSRALINICKSNGSVFV
jgi:hypothetical protein